MQIEFFKLIVVDEKEENLPARPNLYHVIDVAGELSKYIYDPSENKKDWLKYIHSYYSPVTDNDWVEMKTVDDAPKVEGRYWIANENGVFDFFGGIETIQKKFINKTLTHYYPVPVVSPAPPNK